MYGDTWLKRQLREAKKIVKEWYAWGLKWKNFKIFVVNTEEGANAYSEKTQIPAFVAHRSWDSEYGNVETWCLACIMLLNSLLFMKQRTIVRAYSL